MYKKENKEQKSFDNFNIPYISSNLDPNNRWVKLAKMMPWEMIESYYIKQFSNEKGAPAFSARIAFGAIFIRSFASFTDRETVQQIAENPYYQFFLGLKGYTVKPLFDYSMMPRFRKRFPSEFIDEVNEKIAVEAILSEYQKSSENIIENKTSDEIISKKSEKKSEVLKNKGKLILDATCLPADITYPTDLKLLNHARERLEIIIDRILAQRFPSNKFKKKRDYRQKARKNYLKAARRKRLSYKEIQQAILKQLRYVKRDLNIIQKLQKVIPAATLSAIDTKYLETIKVIYKQQKYMFDNNIHKVENRIVNLAQPHVRAVKRGKKGREVEFGAKVSIALIDGFSFIDRADFNPYNESTDLIPSIEKYKKLFGYNPESIHVDQIYRNRENIKYCKANGIRISGPPLGRPKTKGLSQLDLTIRKKLARQDEISRIPVEGKIGELKRRFSLDKVMEKLDTTAKTTISITILISNLKKRLRLLFYTFSHIVNKDFALIFLVIRLHHTSRQAFFKNYNFIFEIKIEN